MYRRRARRASRTSAARRRAAGHLPASRARENDPRGLEARRPIAAGHSRSQRLSRAFEAAPADLQAAPASPPPRKLLADRPDAPPPHDAPVWQDCPEPAVAVVWRGGRTRIAVLARRNLVVRLRHRATARLRRHTRFATRARRILLRHLLRDQIRHSRPPPQPTRRRPAEECLGPPTNDQSREDHAQGIAAADLVSPAFRGLPANDDER